MTAQRSVLVVGAGAVGQVFGLCLARGGARVTYYVREQYRAELARGASLWHLQRRRRRAELTHAPYEVVTSMSELRARSFQQVYLAVPSTGLARPWLDELIEAVGQAVLVNLTPGPTDRELLLAARAAPERLVSGLIAFVAYQAPLPGEDAPAGMTVWFPPGSPSTFSGPAEARDEAIAALVAGGLPARAHPDVLRQAAFLGGALQAFVLALEGAGWSWRELSRRANVRALSAAMRESAQIASTTFGRAPLGLRFGTSALGLTAMLALAPRLAPFPLEAYLRVHFTKVGRQTRHLVQAAIERGKAARQRTDALELLLAAVAP